MGFGKMTGSREERRVLYWWESGCGRCFSSTAISSFNSVTFSCSFTCIIHVHVRTCKNIYMHMYMYVHVPAMISNYMYMYMYQLSHSEGRVRKYSNTGYSSMDGGLSYMCRIGSEYIIMYMYIHVHTMYVTSK